jgi:hypothetical protein
MKKLLLLFVLFTATSSKSQILTLTQSVYEPVAGDTSRAYIMDTTAYGILPIAPTGTNVTWNFSNLVNTNSIVTTAYVNPATSTVTSPSGCSIIQQQGGSFTFLKSSSTPSTQTELMGVNFGTTSVTFTNTGILARYPITYGYSLTDNLSGSVGGTAQATGSVTGLADGHGTLVLPNGNVYNNVLRVKSSQIINVNVFILTIASLKQTVYSYYHSSSKFPVLTINRSTTTFSTNTTQAVTVTANKDTYVIGLKENELPQLQFMLFPNPAAETLQLALFNGKAPESIRITDITGKEIVVYNHQSAISIDKLKSGLYFVEVTSDGNKGRQKFIKH